MTAENNTTEFGKSSLHVAFIVVPLKISLLIVISNTLVFITFKRTKKLQAQHYFMIGLAVADMMTLIPYSQVTAAIAHGSVVTSKEACCWFGVFTIITIGITMWLHSIMSIKKSLPVCKPICHRSITKHKYFQRAVIGIIAVWFLVPTVLCVGMFQSDLLVLNSQSYVPACVGFREAKVLIFLCVPFLVIPMCLQAVTHFLILLKVCSMKNRNVRKNIYRAVKTLSLT